MAKVNYLRELGRFMEYAADEGITAGECLLWHALMHIFNLRAKASDWPDGFIHISNDRLLAYCPMKIDTLARARNRLKQRGLIDFRPGNRNQSKPEYRMIWFYPECYTQKSYNMGDNMGCNMGDNVGGNMGDSNININRTYTEHNPLKDDDDDDDDDILPRAREEETAEEDPIPDRAERERSVVHAFVAAFNRMPTPEEKRTIAAVGWRYGFDARMTELAVCQSARYGARAPAKYVDAILAEWRHEFIRSPEQAEAYRFERDHHVDPEEMNASRERRKADYTAGTAVRRG